MNTFAFVVTTLVLSAWQVRRLYAAGSKKEAWAVALLWIIALVIAVELTVELSLPSPGGLVMRLFRGLNTWLKTF